MGRNVQFFEKKLPQNGGRNSTQTQEGPLLIRWLLRTELVTSRKQAEYILLAASASMIVVATIVWWNIGSSDVSGSVPEGTSRTIEG